MFETKLCNGRLHRFPQTIEDIDKRLHCLLKITRDKMLDACSLCSFLRFNLRGDAGMTGAQLTVSTDRTADGDHGQSPQAHAVRAQTHQLDHIRSRADSAVRPD